MTTALRAVPGLEVAMGCWLKRSGSGAVNKREVATRLPFHMGGSRK